MTDTSLFAADPDDAAEDENAVRRPLLLAGGAVALLGVAVAAVLWSTGGSDDVEAVSSPPSTSAAVTRAATSADPALGAKLPVPFREALGRDPFHALYVQPGPAVQRSGDPTLPTGGGSVTAPAAPTSAPAGSGTTALTDGGAQDSGQSAQEPGPQSATGSAPSGGAPAVGTSPAAQPRSTPPAGAPAPSAPDRPSSPNTPTAQEHRLVLSSVRGSGDDLRAVFTIDGRRTTAAVGAVFGPTRELRLIALQQGPRADQWTAVLQVGDGEPFDVVTGQRVRVR